MFYPRSELENMGFKHLGENVLIDTRTTIDNPERISLGSNVKIGSYAILSGDVEIGSFVHIASFCGLYGGAGIFIDSFVSISNRVCLITESDDYSGESMSAPFVPDKYRFNIRRGKIDVKKHCIIGSGSLLLPAIKLAEGVAVGAMSMISGETDPWGIYVGIPARKIKDRSRNILELEKSFLREIGKNFENFNH
ncbi:acyltransferase [Helicobacter sp.]|uniref:acyltransferase n=1 Tax=Helicobacter sp. TaxID=218 RepID=UPI0025C4CF9F|nr:acyltransferase [Helicobacter sp.]MCI5968212.1 acyltransferase [Helicobacter sp.]MDY2584365.1 acyltransferase [Helicobacter sp.]